MTAAAATAPATEIPTAGVPFWRLVHVELRKSVNTIAGFWLLMAICITVGLTEGLFLIVVNVEDVDVQPTDFLGLFVFLTPFLLPMLGILLITSEWSQRTAMVTFTVEPRRTRVVGAKVVVGAMLCVAMVAIMFLVALACTFVCWVLQPDYTSWEVEWGYFGLFLVVQLLSMAVAFALATLLLNTPAAIVVFFAFWLLQGALVGLFGLIPGLEDVMRWVNFEARLLDLLAEDLNDSEEWAQFFVSGFVWIVVPFTAGLWRILHAEVK